MARWLRVVTKTTVRYIDLGQLAAAHFETKEIRAMGMRRVGELIVAGQKIELQGVEAEEAEKVIREMMAESRTAAKQAATEQAMPAPAGEPVEAPGTEGALGALVEEQRREQADRGQEGPGGAAGGAA